MKSLKVMPKKGKQMERANRMEVSAYSPDALLGRPLNDIEARNAPGLLYTAGPMKIPIPRPRVAIVGTREPTARGIEDADLIARILVEKGVTIVSGLAKGIDTAAHKGAITAGGKTIAVIGTPLDKSYPAQNSELQAEIIKSHLAISQFRVGSRVFKSNFVIRNRTMALIADASVVIQAGETSGTLSQAWEALRLGRPLFIWKPIFETSLRWPHEMVKYGAVKLSDPKDVLQSLPSTAAILKISA
jgi:DNA processing protein